MLTLARCVGSPAPSPRPARRGCRRAVRGARGAGAEPQRSEPRGATRSADRRRRRLTRAELVAAGRTRFAANCGFCHGPGATGRFGRRGPDALRARRRRRARQSHRPARPGGARRSRHAGVPRARRIRPRRHRGLHPRPEDEGGIGDGRTPLRRGRATCRPATRAPDGAISNRRAPVVIRRRAISRAIASRVEGLALLRRMLYPGGQARARPRAGRPPTVTTGDGENDHGRSRLPRRVHDRRDRRRRPIPLLAGRPRQHHHQRSAAGACRRSSRATRTRRCTTSSPTCTRFVRTHR